MAQIEKKKIRWRDPDITQLSESKKKRRIEKPATSRKDDSTYRAVIKLGLEYCSVLLTSNASGSTAQVGARQLTYYLGVLCVL